VAFTHYWRDIKDTQLALDLDFKNATQIENSLITLKNQKRKWS
jgi:hypothetical protein